MEHAVMSYRFGAPLAQKLHRHTPRTNTQTCVLVSDLITHNQQ